MTMPLRLTIFCCRGFINETPRSRNNLRSLNIGSLCGPAPFLPNNLCDDGVNMRFRKKPVVIEAINFDHSVGIGEKIINWAHPKIIRLTSKGFEIPTLEGTMLAERGDWIIKGVKGEFYPCKPDIFEMTYEPA